MLMQGHVKLNSHTGISLNYQFDGLENWNGKCSTLHEVMPNFKPHGLPPSHFFHALQTPATYTDGGLATQRSGALRAVVCCLDFAR